MKLKLTILLFILFFSVEVYSQSSGISLSQQLHDYNASQLNEQLYIQTDREVYYQADTIWFKAYIRDKFSRSESNLSGVFYVNLMSDTGMVIATQQYVIYDSQVQGQILLDKHLKEGFYYLFAYTDWMENFPYSEVYRKKVFIRNESDPSFKVVPFFSKTEYYPGDNIKVQLQCYNQFNSNISTEGYSYRVMADQKAVVKGQTQDGEISFNPDSVMNSAHELGINIRNTEFNIDTLIKIPVNKELAVSFFPEGGHCISGVEGTIAFKACYPDGRPAVLRGTIMDENQKVLASTFTRFDGMGSFPLRPQKGKKYVMVTDQDQRFELPASADEGWQLSATATSNQILVSIYNPSESEVSGVITLQLRNRYCFYEAFSMTQSLKFIIPTDSLPVGVGVLTLFDEQLNPRAERLIFINYQNRNTLTLKTDSLIYHPRDSVLLSLKVTDKENHPVQGTFSLSVYNEILGTTDNLDEPNIVSSGYLLPEVRG